MRQVSWKRLNHLSLFVHNVYGFHVYFHVQKALRHLGISLPNEDNFSKVKNSYIKSAYYSIRDDCGVNADETWMNEDWSYTTKYCVFGKGEKAR